MTESSYAHHQQIEWKKAIPNSFSATPTYLTQTPLNNSASPSIPIFHGYPTSETPKSNAYETSTYSIFYPITFYWSNESTYCSTPSPISQKISVSFGFPVMLTSRRTKNRKKAMYHREDPRTFVNGGRGGRTTH